MPVRVSAADLDMEIMEQARPKEAVREVVNVKQPKQTAVRSLPSADYLTLSMEFSSDAATGRQAVTGAVQGEAQVTNRSVHLAKAHAAPQADLSMSLDFGKETEGVPGPKAGRVAPAKRSAAGLVAARGVGGLEMSSGLLMGQGTGRGNAQDSSKGVAVQQAPARMILRNAKGSIPLGAPLSFRLAEVGKETQSGSAYLRGSTQLKRYIDTKALSENPIIVSMQDKTDAVQHGLVAISYSSSQVVLQYATGKQQVITLVSGEPYPKFELRRSVQGSGAVPVGTKLEEIKACLTTLQRVLE